MKTGVRKMLAYIATKHKLQKYIKTNNMKAGDRLPSENELSELLGVSRLTLREAINTLKHEGLVYSVQGKGTFVACNIDLISDTLNNNLGITEMIEVSGYRPGVSNFEKKLVKADKCVADYLNVVEGTDLLMCKRIRTADDKPVVLSQDFLSPKLSADFLAITDENVSLYSFLEETCGIKMGLSMAQIVPVIADEEMAEKLEMKIGQPLLKLKIVVNDAYGAPLIYAREYLKPDNFKFLIYRWR
jgi:GntR family transcriptional regulator